MKNQYLSEIDVKQVMEPLMEGIKTLAHKAGKSGAIVSIENFGRVNVTITPVKHKHTFKTNQPFKKRNGIFRALVAYNNLENDCVLTVAC